MYDKKADPVLTDYDITINSIHRENMFKGTIIVCIVYAIFAFVLITAAYFSDNIRDLLFDKFLPFTLIYIIGTIIIILIFIYYIVSFVPKKIDKNKLDDSISCPDYWKLEILDDDAIKNSFDTTNYNKKLFKYRCVMDEKVFNKGAIYKQDKNAPTTEQYKLGNKPAFISNSTDDILPTTGSETLNTLKQFLEYNKENDKFYYLYKNVNDYNDKNLTYTNNRNVSSNIKKDLQDAALIMNNYQKIKKDNNVYYEDKIITPTTALPVPTPTAITARRNEDVVTNYLNSPNLLTSASSLSDSINNIAIVAGIDRTYYSTVYDWSTFNLNDYKNKIGDTWNKNVYIIDTNVPTVTNYILVGTMEQNPDNKNIYFKGIKSINIASGLFGNNITYKNYYFDKTYISPSPLSVNVTTSNANLLVKGPKIRLFDVSERPVQIPSGALDTAKIPLMCSAVYPSLLASKEDNYSENNTLRCAYSSICKIPWSDLHCNEIEIKSYT
jgi:hypothetical protein